MLLAVVVVGVADWRKGRRALSRHVAVVGPADASAVYWQKKLKGLSLAVRVVAAALMMM